MAYFRCGAGKPEEEKTVTAGTSAITVTPTSGKTMKKVTVNPTPSQSKSATPSTSAQTISPDSGKLLSSVSVGAIQTETKTVTAGTGASTVTPTSGKYLSSVTVNPTPSQSKTVTPTTSKQTVTPDSGKLLSSVVVNALLVPTGVAITTAPTKTSYKAGETINLSGMVVKVTYSDGTTVDITSQCTFSPSAGTAVYESTDKITVTWVWNNISYTTTQAITVTRVLSSIAITTQPTTRSYVKGDTLSLSGMVVKATYNSGATATVTSYTTSPANGSKITSVGTVTITVSYTENSVTKTTTTTITVTAPIYGVSWDGTSTTKFSRTDAAASFTDPVPYVSGSSSYGSPFDDIYPWNGMVKVTDSTAGTLVAIPKFYYKWTKSGTTMKLQISESAFTGSYVSPAHANRGDGKGERDMVYVGRYHCNSSYKSVTGNSPITNITRATARSGISNLGSAYWQWDYAMLWTIQMLYLVEYGNWNSQTTIGYGCGNNSSKQTVGASDSMPYHTGAMQSSRTTYGVGCQYRYIEDLWGNVYDWCDGVYFSGSSIYCIKNPASFSDSSGGTYTGTRPTSGGYISAYNIPTASGFEYALYPSAVSGSNTTYICDYCNFSSGGVVLCVGGYYNRGLYYGLFYLVGDVSASSSSSVIGSRLQKLP